MAITNASRLADFGSGIGTAGAVLQIDNSSKEVGIGTTNPNATLTVGNIGASGTSIYVHGDGRITGVLTASSFSGAATGLTGNFAGNASGLTGTPNIDCGTGSFTGDVDIADKIVHTGDTDTAIRFSGADTFTVESGGVQRIRVGAAHSNAIGLGHYAAGSSGPFVQISRGQGYDKTTLNPSTSFLHLGGEDNSSSAGFYGIGFGYIYGNPATTAPAYIAYEDRNTASYTYGDLTFWTKDAVTTNTNAIERMRISAGGSVGIGTSRPDSIARVNNTSILNVGILTAYQLHGDGSNLTGTVNTGKAIAMAMIFG